MSCSAATRAPGPATTVFPALSYVVLALVVTSVQALRAEIAELAAQLEPDERRAADIPHRERQLRLVRSLGRKLLQAHLEWIDEVEQELGRSS